MKSMFIVIVVINFMGTWAWAQSSTSSFSDGTKIELATLPPPQPGQPAVLVIQIKQSDGTVCYSITTASTSTTLTPLPMSCAK